MIFCLFFFLASSQSGEAKRGVAAATKVLEPKRRVREALLRTPPARGRGSGRARSEGRLVCSLLGAKFPGVPVPAQVAVLGVLEEGLAVVVAPGVLAEVAVLVVPEKELVVVRRLPRGAL